MEYSLQYYPDPGIAFDIAKMLFVKLTPENIWKPMLTSFETTVQDFLFIQQKNDIFPSPKSELLLFTYFFRSKQMMFITYILTKLISNNVPSFSLSKLLSYFADIEQVKKDLFSFYFSEDIEASGIEHTIRTSSLIPDKIKVYLFGFYLAPHYYTKELQNTLVTYYEIINKHFVISNPESLISSEYITWLFQHRGLTLPQNACISFSLCFTTPTFLFHNLKTTSPYFITSSKSIQGIPSKTSPTTIDFITQTLSAVGDTRRFTILNLLIKHPNMSVKQISSILNLSDTTVNHHISQLKKANLITITFQKRTALYSIKEENLYPAAEALTKLTKGEFLQ